MTTTASADRLLDEATHRPPAAFSPGGPVLATRRARPLLLTSGQIAALLAVGSGGRMDGGAG